MSPWVDAALERSLGVVCFGYIGVADLFRVGKGSHDFEECTLCRWLDLPQLHSNLDRILGNWNLGDSKRVKNAQFYTMICGFEGEIV